MKNKIIAAIIVAVFLASLIPMNIMSTKADSYVQGPIKGLTHPKLERPDNPDEIPAFDGSAFMENAYAEGLVPELNPHSPWTVFVSDDYLGGFYPLDFVNVVNGTHCNIWVGLSPDVWTGGYQDEWQTNGPGFADDVFYFAYPWSSIGGAFWGAPRLLPGYRDYIYGSQLEQLKNEFDSIIWQKDTSFFGQYADRPGPYGDYKIQILVFNIRDGLFWDPLSTPSFIEGYFWSYISNLYNANIIHIDSYQWWRRQGPTPTGGEVAKFVSPIYPSSSLYPYEYEGTFAHEFQHLIHRDIDSNELSWINEACSDLAIVICGFGFPISHLNYYMAYWYSTSLVIWQGTLQNYGASFLFGYYLYEHYGGQPFIYALVHEQANGIQGVNNVLKARHIPKDFDAIFQDWEIANYLDDTSFMHGIYGYYGLNIPSSATAGLSIPSRMRSLQLANPWLMWNVTSYPNTGYNYPYGSSMPYTANYVIFNDGSPALRVDFDGDTYCGIPAHSPTQEWYSDGIPWSWYRLGRTFAIPVTGATLKFWSEYDIEEDWDYGYVEVHDLTTDEWYTLSGVQTISTIPNPQDNPNCPDNVEPTAYLAAVPERWYAFTGSSGGWYQEQMDLTPFAGHSIELYFTYWTDGASEQQGWYVDDIEIPELSFLDNVETGVNGWTVNDGWYITTGTIPNNFEVNFIRTVKMAVGGGITVQSIVHMPLNSAQDGTILLPAMTVPHSAITYGPRVMVAANQPGYEHTFGAYYEFTAQIVPFP